MRRSYLYCLLAVVLAVFSACSDEDNASGGKKPGTDGFFALDAASLKDWDYGLSDGQCCLVFKADSAGGILACAIDKDSGSAFNFFVELDGDGKLTGLGTPDEYYAAAESDDDYTLFKWNDSGGLEGTTIPKTDVKTVSQKAASRAKDGGGSISPAKVVEAVKSIYNFVNNALLFGQEIDEGRWVDMFKHVNDLVQDAAKGFSLGLWQEIELNKDVFPDVITVERVTRFKEVRLDNNLKEIFGDAEIIITYISKQPDGTYVVNTEVSGVNSIKKGEIVVTTETSYVKGENHVYAGVVCRQDYSAFINYYDYISEEAEITRFEGDVVYLSFTLPALGNGTYHVKPYMRSSINFKLVGEGVQYVKYGNEEVINNIGGKITDFTQADAVFMQDSPYEEGYVNFTAYVSAEIDSNDDLEEWGVYYVKDRKYGGYQRFPADMPTAKVKDEIRVEFTVSRDEFDYINYTGFAASKNVQFGVYKKYKNPTGNYDYLTYYYGDMSEFTAVYDKKPTVEVYDAYVTGSSPYDGDSPNLDTWCDFSFKAKVDGCLFMSCLSRKHGSGWDTPNVEYPMSSDESDCMTDRTEYTFSSRYGYSLEGTTNPAIMYIGIWVWPYDGQYESLSTPYAIYCDDGSVSLITGANAVYSKGATARPSLASPVPAKPERTVGLPRAKR